MWYAAGTVTLTNGSVAVVGTNLDFLANGVGAGDALLANGTFNEIARPTSSTSLELVRPWLGATGVYPAAICARPRPSLAAEKSGPSPHSRRAARRSPAGSSAGSAT